MVDALTLIGAESVVELALVLEGESVVEDAAVSGEAREKSGTVTHCILISDESLVHFYVGNRRMDN